MNELLGCWMLLEAPAEFGLDPGATAEFKASGDLVYSIPAADRRSIIRLAYRVSGDRLITNQPSAPREEVTTFRVDGDQLFLTYDGLVAVFERQPV